MNKRLPNLTCFLTSDLDKKDRDGCYKAYFLEGFISETARRMNKILEKQNVYIEKLEKRLNQMEALMKKDK